MVIYRNGILSLGIALSLSLATSSCAGISDSEYEECLERGQRLYERLVESGADPLTALESADRITNCDQYRR